MAVDLTTQSWATVQDRSGNALSGQAFTLTQNSVTVLSGTTDVNGQIAGSLEEGIYTLVVAGQTKTVHVTVGARSSKQAFNVKDYFATGNGTTDDTIAIANAVAAASAAGGGTVVFPPGTYKVSSAISIPNFVSVEGHGQSSVIRAAGNHYVLSFNPANRVRVANLMIDAASTQSGGGAFDYTSAGANIWVVDVYIGSGINTGFNMKPTGAGVGIYKVQRARWNGVIGCNVGFAIGSNTNLVTDIDIMDVSGTAATTADMNDWIIVNNNVDTLRCHAITFYQGVRGIAVGQAASGDVTDSKWSQVCVDMMTGMGINIGKCRGAEFTELQINTCGDPGFMVGATAKGVTVHGGTVQNCTGSGFIIANGSSHILLHGVKIMDNNTSNGGASNGVTVAAGASDWRMLDCLSTNGVLGTGHQKYGIEIGSGASDNFVISGCRFTSNEAGVINNLATGAQQRVEKNMPGVYPSVASAGTVTLPGSRFVQITGTTNITSITASYHGRVVTLLFAGALTLTDGSNLNLAGNFVTTANDTITLVCDGTSWSEIARSVN